jgi:hypothetical protein
MLSQGANTKVAAEPVLVFDAECETIVARPLVRHADEKCDQIFVIFTVLVSRVDLSLVELGFLRRRKGIRE